MGELIVRGISFKIPNSYGKYLFEILDNIDITEFIWSIGGGEAYYVEAHQLDTSLLPTGSIIDGKTLNNIISKKDYYLIFADLKGFTKEEDVREIETYQEFLESKCQFVLLVVDSSWIYIYSKDQDTIKQLHSNAVAAKYENINYLTDGNDTLTTLIAF